VAIDGDTVDRALGILCAEVRALGQRIDELRADLRSRSGEMAELDRRVRAVELRLAGDEAARASADRTHHRWRMAMTALLSGISGVLGALTARGLGGYP
jgi:chromosome segregation ATPase